MAKPRSKRIKKGLTQEAIELERANPEEVYQDEEYQTNLERIYGRRGTPTEFAIIPDNIIPLPPRINGKTVNGIKHAARCTCKDCGNRKISVMQDSILKYPDLFLDVYVATNNSHEEAQFAEMFTRSRCKRAKSLEAADLVVFTGGADVDPMLYGERSHISTRIEPRRDRMEIELYKGCLERGQAMFGVCRGAQFLWVMNGGKLYQNVDNHYGDHSIWDIRNKEFVEKTSSTHHQMARVTPGMKMEIVATSNKACTRTHLDDKGVAFVDEKNRSGDIEAFWCRETACFGVQGHPEYRGYFRYTQWALDNINELFYLNPDFEWKDSQYRMKKELREERGAKLRANAVLYNQLGEKKS